MKAFSFCFYFMTLSVLCKAQQISLAKSSIGSGNFRSDNVSVISIIGQPSPISSIGNGSIRLFQGFQAPLFYKEKTAALSQFSIYPNPNKGVFRIASSELPSQRTEISITLVDTFGREIETIQVPWTREIPCDFSIVGNGIYYLLIKHGNTAIANAKILIL